MGNEKIHINALFFLKSSTIFSVVGSEYHVIPTDSFVSFAGTSFVEEKVTEDHEKVKSTLRTMGIKRVGGTDIGGALVSSTTSFMASQESMFLYLTLFLSLVFSTRLYFSTSTPNTD